MATDILIRLPKQYMTDTRASSIVRRTLVLLSACALGRAKKMALVDYQATIGRQTNEAVSIIPALDVQHAYRIILDAEVRWLDAEIHGEIFFRLARHLETRRGAWKLAKCGASVQ